MFCVKIIFIALINVLGLNEGNEKKLSDDVDRDTIYPEIFATNRLLF